MNYNSKNTRESLLPKDYENPFKVTTQGRSTERFSDRNDAINFFKSTQGRSIVTHDITIPKTVKIIAYKEV